jgi:hypothetical protein
MRAPKERRGLVKFKGWMRRPDKDKPTKDGVHLAFQEGTGKIFHFPPGVLP